MTTRLLAPLLLIGLMAGPNPHAQAQTQPPPSTPSRPGHSRLALSYRLGFNVGVRFKNVGGFPALSLPKTTPNGDLYNYDDGYVLPDISGSEVDTWYWGYQNPTSDPDVISLNRSSAEPVDLTHRDLREGAEITYWRRIRPAGNGHWGLLGALNYTRVVDNIRGTLPSTVRQQNDSFQVLAPPAPQAPYYGTFEGPVPGGPARPLLSLTPTAASGLGASAGAASGYHEFEGDLFGLRLGPYILIPLSKRLALECSGGLALGLASSDYRFHESVTIPGVGTITDRGSASKSEFLVGGFASLELWTSLGQNMGAFIGAQYQYLPSSTLGAGDKRATLELKQSVFLSLGLGYAF